MAPDAKQVARKDTPGLLKFQGRQKMPQTVTPPADVGAKKTRVRSSAALGNPSEPCLVNLPLDKIKGIHPSIKLALQELDIPPLKLPSKMANELGRERMSLLARKPPIVLRGTQLWCVGNLRSYQLAKNFLGLKDQIRCIEIFDLSDAQIVDEFLIEFFYDPAIFGIHASDLSIVVQAARRAIEADKWKAPNMAVDVYFRKLYFVDKRKFVPQTINGGPDKPNSAEDPAMPSDEAQTTEE